MARTRLLVRVVVIAVVIVAAVVPAAAFAATGLTIGPEVPVDVPVDTDEVTAPPEADPPVTDIEEPTLPDEVTGLIEGADGDDGLAGPGDEDDAAPRGGDDDRDTGTSGATGRSDAGDDDDGGSRERDSVTLTPAGARAPAEAPGSSNRVLRLARPLAPAVVIAILGLLLLAAAARGNDKLVKREAGDSQAGSWRL